MLFSFGPIIIGTSKLMAGTCNSRALCEKLAATAAFIIYPSESSLTAMVRKDNAIFINLLLLAIHPNLLLSGNNSALKIKNYLQNQI